MNIKILTLVVPLVSTVFMVSKSPETFDYKYKIIANSYHPVDDMNVYNYKEKLINKYQELCFSHLEREYTEIIVNNINSFCFDSNCVSSYKDGGILLIIGNGNGRTYTGNLKKNECDESVIREKFYIYELFN